jgi:hypothetical protein
MTFYMELDGHGKPKDGFMYRMLESAAKIGEFDLEYVEVAQPDEDNEDVTDRIADLVPHVDLYTTVPFSDTSERRQRGIGFLRYGVDHSLVLITSATLDNLHNSNYSFLRPLSWTLWLSIFSLAFFTGISHWLFDPIIKRGKSQTLVQSLQASLGAFVGGLFHRNGCESQAPYGQMINLGYSFFIMIALSGFIAHAAFLFLNARILSPNLLSIDEANSKGSRLCVEVSLGCV